MKKPSKPELLALLRKVNLKISEHQKQDTKIMSGYTLAANIKGLTELSNEITSILCANLK